ncbi:MAG: hypothetical protein AAF518_04120 [Spirochaetota bacterium]
MSEEKKAVIERSQGGDFVLSSYGEFLSYYHTDLQLFKKILKSNGQTDKDSNKTLEKIKAFMVTNIKKVGDFTESIEKFSVFLSLSPDEFNAYMSENFLDVLTKVQKKLIDQELENRKSINDYNYNSITEEIVEVIGEIIPDGSRFVKKENLLVVENAATGEITEPSGMLSQIKKAQEEEEEKQQAKQQKRMVKKEAVFEVEKSLLLEILEKHGDSLGNTVDVNHFQPAYLQQAGDVETIIKEPEKPDGLLSDVPELEFEEDELEVEKSEPETPPDMDSIDLDDILSAVPASPDEADGFFYQQHMQITATVQSYKKAKDGEGYNSWLAEADMLTKSVIAMRGSLAKESAGQSIDWQKNIADLVEKTQLSPDVLQKLHNRLKHFLVLKSLLDITVQQFKTFPPESLRMAKNAWPHIQKAFGESPKYEEVEQSIQQLLDKIRDPSIRQPIETILGKCLAKTKEDFAKYDKI